MNHLAVSLMMFASLSLSMDNDPFTTADNRNTNGIHMNPTESKMKITVGSAVFTATLYDNQTVTAFKAMLPLTIKMGDLNDNEKFYNFSSILPTSSSVGGNIKVGDLMLYGNNCLVLFYKGFNTSYSYTKLGKIDDVAGLIDAMGSGNVTVKYESK